MIIGLVGPARSGKDTAGAILARELGGTCIAFADPMKRFCREALGLTIDQLWGDKKEKPISKTQLKSIEKVFSKMRAPQVAGDSTPWMNRFERATSLQFDGVTKRVYEREMMAWWQGLKAEKNLTPRRVLQTFGTEFGRKHLGDGFWVNVGLHTADHILSGKFVYTPHGGSTANEGGSIQTKNAVIFTDCRFRNEVLALKKAGAKVYRVKRMVQVKRTDTITIDTKHSSESEQGGIPDFWLDGSFFNPDGGRQRYEANVKHFALKLKAGTGYVL